MAYTINKNTNNNVSNNVNSVNSASPEVKYTLSITCLCGGRYFPLTYKIGDIKSTFYRCNKCGKDINVKLTPVNNK